MNSTCTSVLLNKRLPIWTTLRYVFQVEHMSSLDGRGEGGGECRYRETEEGKCCHRVEEGDAGQGCHILQAVTSSPFLSFDGLIPNVHDLCIEIHTHFSFVSLFEEI